MAYIECKHSSQVKCKFADGTAIEFYPFVLNKYTGQPLHSGYTEVSEEQLERLQKESKVFISFMKQKLLILRDTLPASAQNPATLLAEKEQELIALRNELALLKQEGGLTQADIDAAVKAARDEADEVISGKEDELSNAHDEIQAQAKELDRLRSLLEANKIEIPAPDAPVQF